MVECLNAPFGARCFLTMVIVPLEDCHWYGLNAPFGARCFLTPPGIPGLQSFCVLMHLLALGAFWQKV